MPSRTWSINMLKQDSRQSWMVVQILVLAVFAFTNSQQDRFWSPLKVGQSETIQRGPA